MLEYERLLAELKSYAEPGYAAFHKRLLKDESINVLGVRVPTLRKLAKKYKNEIDPLLCFNDDYYEVTFLKLQAVALLPWEQFIRRVDDCVKLIDNWATCDSFAPKCIAGHKDEFSKKIDLYLSDGNQFTRRFALTTLLHFYVERGWLEYIFDAVQRVDCNLYYVHMAAAWLVAEVLVKFYDEGVAFLKLGVLDVKTHNKAIQKACESYRLTDGQKRYLRNMKKQ